MFARTPLLATALATSLTLAATASFAAGTITSGTTTMSFTGTPMTAATGNAGVLFNGSFLTDMLFRYGWSYNQGVGTSTRPFSSLNSPTELYSGNTATFSWANAGAGAAGTARWDAVMVITLVQLAPGAGNTPGSAQVNTRLSFTASANNAGNATYNLYHHLDMDIIGTAVNNLSDDVYSVMNPNSMGGVRTRAVDNNSAHYSEQIGVGADRYEFNTGSALRTKLGYQSGTGTGNLNTLAGATAANWASTDGAVAFQWTDTLAPGQTMVYESSFTINAAVPEPGTWALLAAGGALVAGVARRRRRQG